MLKRPFWIPVALMSGSLALLALFLAFWLRKTYVDALEVLKKESNVVFISTIRDIEGEYLTGIMRRSIMLPPDTLSQKMRYPEQIYISRSKLDSNRRALKLFNHHLRRDSQVDVVMKVQEGGEATRFHGSLSLMIALNKGGEGRDSFRLMATDSTLPVLILPRFDEKMQEARLPMTYRMVEVNDSAATGPAFRSDTYVDMATGEEFAAEFTGFGRYVWWRILPEIAFAALLYACVALAFFTIYRGWKKQRRLTELKNDFINNMTHELKTPIATVSVAVEALRSFDALHDPRRTGEYLDIARHELNRLSILVDKVLKMSLFEHASPVLQAEPLDLKAVIEEVMASMRLQFEKSGARVQFETDGADFTLTGDRLHLTSVIYNLLDNALKYSGAEPEIQVGLAQENGALKMTVRDRGIGIPVAYSDRIFDKFFRVPSGDVHTTRGHGLGLHYVANVIRQHLGSIRVDSRPGEPGTCFTVLLPRPAP